jgi:hypothetical protein
MMSRPIGVAALVLGGAVLLLALAAAPSQANVPGKNGLIVFQRLVGTPSKTCNPCTQVFTIRADGSGLRQITVAGCSPRTLPGRLTASASSWSTERASGCWISALGRSDS